MTNLLVLDLVPAWFGNRLKRLGQMPKRYLVDPALIGAALGVTIDTVLFDHDLLGRVIDTFVVAQLRAEASVAETEMRLHHLRHNAGRHEVDVVVELGGGRIVAIEIKASSRPGPSASRHLAWLRDELADRFAYGLVLHTGRFVQQLDDRIMAAPIATLWT